MLLTYQPEGAEAKTWSFKPGKMLSPEIIAIEKLTGMPFGVWREALFSDHFLVVHALLYTLMKRDSPTLRPEHVQFTPDEVKLDLDDDERRDIAAELERKRAAEGLTEDEEAALAEVRAGLPPEAEAEESDPKE